MSEIVNEAVIKVTADASGVEAGLRKVSEHTAGVAAGLQRVDDTAKKTGRTLENLGSGPGLRPVGEGAGAAAGQVDRATKNMADAIQRATSMMSAGAKGSAQYYEALANSRGINVAALKPYLDQLDQATRKAALAADAQKKLEDSTKFLADLRTRSDSIGKTASELAELRAAQLGVSEAARPMIESMRAAEQEGQSMFESLKEKAGEYKLTLLGLAAAATAAAAAGAAMVYVAIDDLAQLDDMAQKTGSSVENLSKIQKVAAVFNQDMGEIDGALVKLAKNMANADEKGSKFAKAMEAIGISTKDIKKRDTGEVFVEIAKKLQGFNDSAGKTALVTDAMGKSAADLLPYMNDLAENVDNVGSSSKKAAGEAAALQDEIGWMKLRSKELATTVATATLPAMSDLAGAFNDVLKNQDKLNTGKGSEWADDLAVGLARVADIAVLIPRILSTIAGSFKAVGADIALLGTAAMNLNPIAIGRNVAQGKNPFAGIKEALVERNAVVAESNRKLDDLWNKPANEFEQAVLKRFAARGKGAAPDSDAGKDLNYTGSDDEAKSAEKAADAYRDLIISINEKIKATAAESASLVPLTESQKLQITLDEQLASGKLKLSPARKAEYEGKLKELSANEAIIASNKRLQASEALETKGLAAAQAELRSIAEQVKAQEQANEQIGLTGYALVALQASRLDDAAAQKEQTAAILAFIPNGAQQAQIYRDQAAELRNLATAKRSGASRQATVDEATKALSEQKDLWQSIERTAHDTFISIFDSGKSAFDRLKDTLKNGLYELLYQMTMKRWIMNISGNVAGSGGGIASIAQAAAGGGGGAGSGVGSTISGLGALGSLTSGLGLLGAGGLGLQAGFGALMSGGFAGISAAVSGGIAAIGAGTGASIAAGIGTIAGALGPIALGIGAAVAIWKKLDTSGTYHAGGAASATSAGVTAVSAGSLNMERIQSNAATQQMVGELASGVVSILDSTALAFGKTAGYQAATAFADDTSKDGAWGSLVISKMGQSLVNWQDTRGNGKWSQKTFADGDKGQEQYLAALTASVRTALDTIGLPEWAKTILNGVASDASLEDLAKVVDQINKTQAALGAMRSQLTGFASLSDTAVSALMAASGGIDKLFTNASAYYDAFYTEAEKNSTVNGQIAKQLAAVNLVMPATREGFRALVESQMKLGTQGADSVSVLLGVAGAFAQLHPEVEAVTKDLAAQRSALTEAYNAESSALQEATGRATSFAKSLRDLSKNALLGSLSPLSPQQKLAEARSQYEATVAAARSGDQGAQDRYQDIYTAFLEASRAVNASGAGYQQDFSYAQAMTEEVARWAGEQVDVGQAQLDSLKASVTGIIDVNKSVLSVRDALLQYHEAMGKNTMPLTAVAPPVNTPIPYNSYGTQNTEALVMEVKALRTEIAGLRGDGRVQTGDQIRGVAGAVADSAVTIARAVTGMGRRFADNEERVFPE